jgi:hypothetical protein
MKNNLKKTHFLSKILCLASMLALSLPIAASAQIPIELPAGRSGGSNYPNLHPGSG